MGVAVFIVANDFTALAVALPAIEKQFNSDVGMVQWVINAYALTFGVLIVVGGRLADIFGRKRIFIVGAAIFASFSVLGGAAQSVSWLIACRALMGVGGRRAESGSSSAHDSERCVHAQLGVFGQRAPQVIDARLEVHDPVPALLRYQFWRVDVRAGGASAQPQVMWIHAAIDRLEAHRTGLDRAAREDQAVLDLDDLEV
jgi:hypothetical protein